MTDYLQNPWALLLGLAIPLLICGWISRRPKALLHPLVHWLGSLPSGRARRARWGGIIFRTLGLALVVGAIAGPRWPDRGSRIETEGIALMLALDTSGSMAETDFRWQDEPMSRLEGVKRAVELFVNGGIGPNGERLNGRPEDLIGYVPFAARPETGCPLTLSHSVLLALLWNEQPRSLPTESETNIGDALAWSLDRLEAAGNRHKVLVLLSDGEQNVPPPALKPRQAAQLAANLHVPIYTVYAGPDPESTTNPEAACAALRTMQTIAAMTGARSFQAHDVQSLIDICTDIDRLERSPIASFQYRRYWDLAPWFGLAALASLAGVSLLEITLWRKIP